MKEGQTITTFYYDENGKLLCTVISGPPDVEATKRALESFKRMDREHEERLKKLQEVKGNLPEGKEKLNLEEIASRLFALYYGDKMPSWFVESCEMDYYLDYPELKNTDEYVEMINGQYREP